MTPLLTIVVPTKDRQHTAAVTIEEITRISDVDQVQVVIQDCSADASLLDALKARGIDTRVEYHYQAGPVSMTDNWNRAMEHVRGEYIVIVGDDDAVWPEIVSVCRWAKENGFDAVKSRQASCYWHPDYPSDELAATMRLAAWTGSVVVRETASMLPRLMVTGDYYYELPLVYYGLIRTGLLHRLRERSGKYFDGIAPDIYSGFAIACMTDRFADIDYPLVIIGASGRANSGRIEAGTAHLHFVEFQDYRFSWLAPETWHFTGSNPDNAVLAVEAAGRPDLVKYMDVARIYARTIAVEPRHALRHVRKYLRVMRRQKRNVGVGLLRLLLFVIGKFALALVRKRPERKPGQYVTHVTSLRDAIVLQRDWLRGRGVTPPLSHR
jgi:glycosyltransferase involved in cell wall biosynthesis